MKINLILFLVIIFLFISCNENNNSTNQCSCANALLDSIATVDCSYIVDGDTWRFYIGSDVISVRVLGIDCFETKHNTRLDSQANRKGISVDSAFQLGVNAKSLADSLLGGKKLVIIRDYTQDNFDTYNRLLRYTRINGKSYDSIIKSLGLDSQ